MIGTIGIWHFTSRSGDTAPRFEGHEFAVFRSEYETLRTQSPMKRAEHFRDLLDITETAQLTPSIAETLADFCQGVATSEEEAPLVQAEAKLVLRSLKAKEPARAPASLAEVGK